MSDMKEEWVEKMRQAYNDPPETPRDEMWQVISERVGSEGPDVIPIPTATRHGFTNRSRWIGTGLAAAALLVIGIGLGRMSMQTTPEGAVMIVPEQATNSQSYRTAALRHLSRSESLLSFVRSESRAGQLDAELGQWSRALLLETRLLKDSPAGQDEVLKRLLDDLELILVQVSQLTGVTSSEGLPEELSLLTEAMQERDMMMRIRAVLPAGAAQAGI